MKIVTLSPVHIGSGEEITPWEYGLVQGKVEVYKFENVVRELSQHFSGQRLKNTMLELRDRIRNEGFNSTLGDFLHRNNVEVEPLYRVDCNTKLKEGRYKVIKEFIKTEGKVYIPGSEIKGALRTLFIFGLIYRSIKKQDNNLMRRFKGIIENTLKRLAGAEQRERKKIWDKANIQLNKLILCPKGDAKYDLFRAVKVGDTSSVDPSQTLYIDTITLVGSRRSFLEPHELIKEGGLFEFNLDISEEDKRALKKIYTGKDMHERIDLLTLEFLHESSQHFYKFLLDIEKEFFERCRKNDVLRSLSNVENSYVKGDFILRIGKHQGFLSITAMLPIYLGDKNLFGDTFKNIFKNARHEPVKTRKVTSSGKVLGWCKLLA